MRLTLSTRVLFVAVLGLSLCVAAYATSADSDAVIMAEEGASASTSTELATAIENAAAAEQTAEQETASATELLHQTEQSAKEQGWWRRRRHHHRPAHRPAHRPHHHRRFGRFRRAVGKLLGKKKNKLCKCPHWIPTRVPIFRRGRRRLFRRRKRRVVGHRTVWKKVIRRLPCPCHSGGGGGGRAPPPSAQGGGGGGGGGGDSGAPPAPKSSQPQQGGSRPNGAPRRERRQPRLARKPRLGGDRTLTWPKSMPGPFPRWKRLNSGEWGIVKDAFTVVVKTAYADPVFRTFPIRLPRVAPPKADLEDNNRPNPDRLLAWPRKLKGDFPRYIALNSGEWGLAINAHSVLVKSVYEDPDFRTLAIQVPNTLPAQQPVDAVNRPRPDRTLTWPYAIRIKPLPQYMQLNSGEWSKVVSPYTVIVKKSYMDPAFRALPIKPVQSLPPAGKVSALNMVPKAAKSAAIAQKQKRDVAAPAKLLGDRTVQWPRKISGVIPRFIRLRSGEWGLVVNPFQVVVKAKYADPAFRVLKIKVPAKLPKSVPMDARNKPRDCAYTWPEPLDFESYPRYFRLNDNSWGKAIDGKTVVHKGVYNSKAFRTKTQGKPVNNVPAQCKLPAHLKPQPDRTVSPWAHPLDKPYPRFIPLNSGEWGMVTDRWTVVIKRKYRDPKFRLLPARAPKVLPAPGKVGKSNAVPKAARLAAKQAVKVGKKKAAVQRKKKAAKRKARAAKRAKKMAKKRAAKKAKKAGKKVVKKAKKVAKKAAKKAKKAAKKVAKLQKKVLKAKTQTAKKAAKKALKAAKKAAKKLVKKAKKLALKAIKSKKVRRAAKKALRVNTDLPDPKVKLLRTHFPRKWKKMVKFLNAERRRVYQSRITAAAQRSRHPRSSIRSERRMFRTAQRASRRVVEKRDLLKLLRTNFVRSWKDLWRIANEDAKSTGRAVKKAVKKAMKKAARKQVMKRSVRKFVAKKVAKAVAKAAARGKSPRGIARAAARAARRAQKVTAGAPQQSQRRRSLPIFIRQDPSQMSHYNHESLKLEHAAVGVTALPIRQRLLDESRTVITKARVHHDAVGHKFRNGVAAAIKGDWGKKE